MRRRSTAASGFLGTGWSFPPQFARGGVDVAMVSGAEDVHQSLLILLATQLGERPMQPMFGCNLDSVMFETIEQRLVNRITSLIHDAVLAHETRIELHDVAVSVDGEHAGLLQITLSYTVLGTNSRFNMVYPFYLNEATAAGM